MPAPDRPVVVPVRIVEADAELRRRRVVVGIVIVIGTALLAATLRLPQGSGWFAVLALLLATTWTVGALLSGPIAIRPPGPVTWTAVVLPAAAVGVVGFVVVLVVGAIGRRLPVVSGALEDVLATADAESMALVLTIALINAMAEELFFRGAVYAALRDRRPALTSTVVYVAVTVATGNVVLIAAAAALGSVVGLQRARTRSVLGPMITHGTWSALVLLALPR